MMGSFRFGSGFGSVRFRIKIEVHVQWSVRYLVRVSSDFG